MREIGLELPASSSAHTLEEALDIAREMGKYPLVIRPGFTLGGTGGGIAYNEKELIEIVTRGLDASRNSEVLIEESLLGWKEYEMEVMRDKKDNSVIVCSIENLDPMGVHTGDSITVAPAQTLTDREYQIMRDKSLDVLRVIGVETGGSNVQWAMNPENGRMIIIEMNPRVSRSSALASKATGFPIAKIAAKLAIGYTLDEILNDITRETPACFEPSIDYVVTKIPRFAFEKFPTADSTLTTQMKSVGEVMSIGKNFKESFQKALRSLETGRAGFGADGKDGKYEQMSDEHIHAELKRPNAERMYILREALKRGWSVEKIHEITAIDPWYLRHMHELAMYEDEIKSAGNLDGMKKDPELLKQAKSFGYSDRQLAWMLKSNEREVFKARKELGILPAYNLVDTCAGEFESYTPYFYSTYNGADEVKTESEKKKIMILGGGPNRIGQGIEFDYCCVHASFALQKAGFETIMVNSNPETVSTDYDTSDKLYFEPLTLEDVLHIYEREQCDGVIVQFGGQTPLNLAKQLEECGVKIIGTKPGDIEAAEDRDFFKKLCTRVGIQQPPNGIATNIDQAVAIASEIGYPVLMRPSFVLGGRAMVIVYKEEYLRKYMTEAVEASEARPVLIDRFLEEAIELDVDCISDGETSVIGAVMEHVELAGVHSGDSACSIPVTSLSKEVINKIHEYTYSLAKELNVCGLMNIQFAVKDEQVYILEVNPRASRTVPFVSKAIGAPLAKLAALTMVGKKLKELGFTSEVTPDYTVVKEAVFPFVRFPGIDIVLSPEMKSTGEVMGIDYNPGLAYLKTQVAAGNTLPDKGNVFISFRDIDKEAAIPLVKELIDLGFNIYATRGTATCLYEAGIKTNAMFRISRGRPNVLDMMNEESVQWIINTPSTGAEAMVDEIQMRAQSIRLGIPITTTLCGMAAAIDGLKALREMGRMEICSIQEFHRHSPKLDV
ncbi:MAG: carbamoyl-phosphate synthase large subunit, partial [Victivallales bacterium]|nr:carbamoyl-phosphate synthase large subunit [Victivallales bacterium]